MRNASLFGGAVLIAVVGLSGCRSKYVEATVTNATGGPVTVVEVDYPSASFGADSLAAGADFHYRIQLQGSGTLKVQYTASGGKQVKINGPMLYERQQGALSIVLLPEGKAEFGPHLTPGS